MHFLLLPFVFLSVDEIDFVELSVIIFIDDVLFPENKVVLVVAWVVIFSDPADFVEEPTTVI